MIWRPELYRPSLQTVSHLELNKIHGIRYQTTRETNRQYCMLYMLVLASHCASISSTHLYLRPRWDRSPSCGLHSVQCIFPVCIALIETNVFLCCVHQFEINSISFRVVMFIQATRAFSTLVSVFAWNSVHYPFCFSGVTFPFHLWWKASKRFRFTSDRPR